jgi:hypothetical protein
MIKSNRLIWDNIAPRFAAELVASTSEVHFGVRILVNSTFNLSIGTAWQQLRACTMSVSRCGILGN